MIEDLIRNIMNMPPSKRKVASDLALIEKETREWRESIIPWERDNEIELFSLNKNSKWFKKSGEKFLKGVFYSIYNEPMMVFGFRSYMKKGEHFILWAATDRHVFFYRGHGKKMEFFIDGDRIGHINDQGLMYGGSRGRLLARRNPFSDEYYNVVVWDREVAHMLKPTAVDRINPRAFEVVEKLNKQEFLLLLSLGFQTIIIESFGLEVLGQ